jgi:hypothetical protein
MSLRARIFIIITVVVLIVLGISLFLLIGARKKAASEATGNAGGTAATATETGLPPAPTGTEIPSGLPVKKQTTVEVEQAGVTQLARVFTERYGTYSTQNDSQNIKEVESLCTRALWSKISARIGASAGNQNFVGVTTRVITTELASWNGSTATVELRTMRTEEKSGEVTNKYQNAEVKLIKSGENWLVDQFVWK